MCFLKECVFRMLLTFCHGKRLFFISVFSVFFYRTLKNSIINRFVCVFIDSTSFYEQRNFFAFVYSLFLMLHILSFLNDHKMAHCVKFRNLYKKKLPS